MALLNSIEDKNLYKKSLAFTLAEVLIVIAVIGITATLTLPNLTNNLDEKKVVSSLRKIYPELETAYQAVVAEYGRPPEWADAASNANASTMSVLLQNKIIKHLSVSDDLYSIEGSAAAILKDGSRVEFYAQSLSDMKSNYSTSYIAGVCTGYLGYILVDIDGNEKGENSSGKDRFQFNICYNEGLVPEGETSSGPTISGSNAAWVIKAGNMDYLKCAGDLNWNTKRTCK